MRFAHDLPSIIRQPVQQQQQQQDGCLYEEEKQKKKDALAQITERRTKHLTNWTRLIDLILHRRPSQRTDGRTETGICLIYNPSAAMMMRSTIVSDATSNRKMKTSIRGRCPAHTAQISSVISACGGCYHEQLGQPIALVITAHGRRDFFFL